jgi:hypothetical protein
MPDAMADTIMETLTSLAEPGQVVELSAEEALPLKYQRPQTVSSYLDDLDKLAEATASLQQAKRIDITLNSINPALLTRAANRLRTMRIKDASTLDANVFRRR